MKTWLQHIPFHSYDQHHVISDASPYLCDNGNRRCLKLDVIRQEYIDDSGAKIFIYNETETSQRTDFKTQIKRAAVKGTGRLIKIYSELLTGIKVFCFTYQKFNIGYIRQSFFSFASAGNRAVGGLFYHLGDEALYNTAVKSITG